MPLRALFWHAACNADPAAEQPCTAGHTPHEGPAILGWGMHLTDFSLLGPQGRDKTMQTWHQPVGPSQMCASLQGCQAQDSCPKCVLHQTSDI